MTDVNSTYRGEIGTSGTPRQESYSWQIGLRKTGFDGRAGKNLGRFIFAFFNSIDPSAT